MAFMDVVRLIAVPIVLFGWGVVLVTEHGPGRTSESPGPRWADLRIWIGLSALGAGISLAPEATLGQINLFGSLAVRVAVLVIVPLALGPMLGWRVRQHDLAHPDDD